MISPQIRTLMEQVFDEDSAQAYGALDQLASLDDPQAVEALKSISKWAPQKEMGDQAKALAQRLEGGPKIKRQRLTARLTALVRPGVPDFMRPRVPKSLGTTTASQAPQDEASEPSQPITAARQAMADLERTLKQLDTFRPELSTRNATSMKQRADLTWSLWFLSILGLTALSGWLVLGSTPDLSMIAWLVLIAGIIAIFYEPRYGIYQILFFGLVGDYILIPWFPFVKNFSSKESLLFFNDAVIISPLEAFMVLTLLVWLGKGAMRRQIEIYRSELFWPALVFAGFMVYGIVYGIGRGGDLTIALWESRAILYLPLMLILTSNLIEKREHVSHLFWCAMIALFIEGVAGVYYYTVLLGFDLSTVQSISEHASSIHMNTFFVMMLAVWLYQGSIVKRLTLPILVPPILLTYVANQRRASFLTLGIALFLMSFVLYKESRKVFFLIMPPLAIFAIVYTGIFWNSTGALGLPAQAIKSVVAEDQSSEADQSSNVYRLIENANSAFTIHQVPFTGVGFGNKFYIVVPMPDISFFDWWEYITHNSIIWVWMKTGFGGFFSMMVLFGLSILVGVRAVWRLPSGDLSAAALTGTLYIIMHFIYAYVDMSWDSQSMLYVGTMMGLISGIERVVARPVPIPRTRWPWQSAPPPAPSLVPLLHRH